MSIKSEIVGDNLVITIGVGKRDLDNATVSKSALEKALAKGLPEPEPTLVASSGGFIRAGAVKFSLNVMKA